MEQLCILVADDDADIVNAVRLYLEKEGFAVFGAANGLEALDILEKETVHLILMDVMMPRLDGFSAIMRIRQKRNLPILVMSAKTEDSDKVLGLSIGADDYITKPFSAIELVADGAPVKLTPTETRIMELFMKNPGRIFSAEEIYARVWNEAAAYAPENTVMVHIRRIREKIELNPKDPEYLKVVWGLGYRLEKK